MLAERFQAVTADPAHYQTLRDLVVSIFRLLEHTPFWTMGMNRDMHFKIETEERWHQHGEILAPKQKWEAIVDRPGLRTSVISQKVPILKVGELQVLRNIRVEPSSRVQPGVYIQLNVEASLPGAAQGDTVRQQHAGHELIKFLSESWNDMLSEAQKIADHLLSIT